MHHLKVRALFFDVICKKTSITKALLIYDLFKRPYILPWFNEKHKGSLYSLKYNAQKQITYLILRVLLLRLCVPKGSFLHNA